MNPATNCHPHRELARRVSGGLEIALYWCPIDDSTSLEVWQPASAERFAFLVPREQALDVFYHPFAHFPIATGEPSRAQERGARP
jgi:hypothetical protein